MGMNKRTPLVMGCVTKRPRMLRRGVVGKGCGSYLDWLPREVLGIVVRMQSARPLASDWLAHVPSHRACALLRAGSGLAAAVQDMVTGVEFVEYERVGGAGGGGAGGGELDMPKNGSGNGNVLRIQEDVLRTSAYLLPALGSHLQEVRVHVRADSLLELLILLKRHCRCLRRLVLGAPLTQTQNAHTHTYWRTVLRAPPPQVLRLSGHHAYCLARAATGAGVQSLELRHVALGPEFVLALRAHLRVSELSLVECPVEVHLHGLWYALARYLRVLRISPPPPPPPTPASALVDKLGMQALVQCRALRELVLMVDSGDDVLLHEVQRYTCTLSSQTTVRAIRT